MEVTSNSPGVAQLSPVPEDEPGQGPSQSELPKQLSDRRTSEVQHVFSFADGPGACADSGQDDGVDDTRLASPQPLQTRALSTTEASVGSAADSDFGLSDRQLEDLLSLQVDLGEPSVQAMFAAVAGAKAAAKIHREEKPQEKIAIAMPDAALQCAEAVWRGELSTSQTREAGLRYEVEAAHRELAEYRWNVRVHAGSSRTEALETASSSKSLVLPMPRRAGARCNCHPSAVFLESRMAEVREQVTTLQEEVAASTASEEKLLHEVLQAQSEIQAAGNVQEAEMAEMRTYVVNAEKAEMRFMQDAVDARSDQVNLRTQVGSLQDELRSAVAYETEEGALTVLRLQAEVSSLQGELRSAVAHERHVSDLTVAMLRSEVQTAFNQANQVEARWQEEFKVAKDRWQSELAGSNVSTSGPCRMLSAPASAQASSEKHVGASPSNSTSSTAASSAHLVKSSLLSTADSVKPVNAQQTTPRTVSPSPQQRIIAPPSGWQGPSERVSSVERRRSSPREQTLPPTAAKVIQPPLRQVYGAPPPSLTPPVKHVPFAPWGLERSPSASQLLPAPRKAAAAPTSPSVSSSRRACVVQRMSSMPSLTRHTPHDALTTVPLTVHSRAAQPTSFGEEAFHGGGAPPSSFAEDVNSHASRWAAALNVCGELRCSRMQPPVVASTSRAPPISKTAHAHHNSKSSDGGGRL